MTRRTVRSLIRAWIATLVLIGAVGSPLSGLMAGESPRVHPLNARPVVKAQLVVDPGTSNQSVFLGGQFIEVGIHNVGSFGASSTPPGGFHPTDAYLGFVVDGDGFDIGVAPVVGDFFVPGTPEEVWGIEWNSVDGAITRMNAGLMNEIGIPTDVGYPTDISVGSDRRSVWRGIAVSPQTADEQLTITQTVSFSQSDKFFVINVVLNNSGRSTITGLKYLRSVDPDQESGSPAYYGSETANYVVAQPPRGQLQAFPAGNTDRALVIGRGVSTGVPLGLGTIDGRARVSHGGFSVRSASAVLDLGIADGQLSDSGRQATPSVGDEAISLAFDLGDLAPGQSVSIDYAYILDAADLDVALGQLARVTILQPTGTVSGNNALFQVSTNNPDSPTIRVDFYVAGVLVGADDDGGRTGTFETYFNTLSLPNGPVTIEAIATFEDDSTSRKSASVTVDNGGPPIAFSVSTPVQDAVVSGSAIPIEVEGTDGQNPPTQVSIFREAFGTSPLLLANLTQPPFIATMDVSDLADGTSVVIKAVASNVGGGTTTISRTVLASQTPPGDDAVVTAPTLPLSQGDRTIYVAVSPSTPQGRISLLAALTGTDPTVTRSFTWDATYDHYVERPSSPTGGVQVSTGFFIATRVPVSFNLDGTSVAEQPVLTLSSLGWVFAGVPPYDNGSEVQTEFLWSDTVVVLDGEITLDDVSSPTLAEAMGNGVDAASARPWFWNGAAYEQVDTLQSGKAYWFKNNLEGTLRMTFGTTVVDLTKAAGPKPNGKTHTKSSGKVYKMRDQGTPPPPPSSATSSAASSGGGCGAGSGISAFLFLLLMAGTTRLIARR